MGNFRNLLLDNHKAQFIMHYCSRRHHIFSTTDLPVHTQTCPLSSSDINVTFTGTNSSLLQMSGKERFDWSQAEGARTVKRKLYLQHDDFGIYNCPVHHCEHGGFNSKRGCRKRIDTKHSWFYFFDEKPAVQLNRYISEEGTADCTCAIRKTANTRKIPHFPVNEGIGKDFVSWLSSACGGGVAESQAKQQSVRIMKFLKYCSEDDEDEVSRDFVDYCIGSPCLVSKFIEHSREEWSLTSSAQINYLQAIADMIDFRKFEGAAQSSARSFSLTEVCIHRGKRTLSKRKRYEWTKELDIDNLEAMNSWTMLEELQSVVPFHYPRYNELLQMCKKYPMSYVAPGELTFCTRFVAVYLFIKVKGSRPMTYQYLTVPMFNNSKKNGGFVDQTEFKTALHYNFDSLLFDNNSTEIVDDYITFVRPLLHPDCDYVLVTRNGTQYSKLSDLMSKLVFEAIGKYIHPTRYRQIVETESVRKLSPGEQDIMSRDQKHSSQVAKTHYQKLSSREIAEKAKHCFGKLFSSPSEKGCLRSDMQIPPKNANLMIFRKAVQVIMNLMRQVMKLILSMTKYS